MEDKKQVNPVNEEQEKKKPQNSEWATEALKELDDFIESQGIYIRQ